MDTLPNAMVKLSLEDIINSVQAHGPRKFTRVFQLIIQFHLSLTLILLTVGMVKSILLRLTA